MEWKYSGREKISKEEKKIKAKQTSK